MNMPVLVDWLTLLLAPVVLIGLGLAFSAARSARKAGENGPPGWARTVQGVAVATAIFLGLIRIVWGG